MQQIMAHCFLAVKAKLECKLGYFDLIGCDFLIDENFKVLLRLSGTGGEGGAGRQVQEAVAFCAHLTTQAGPWGGQSGTLPSPGGDVSIIMVHSSYS